LKTRGHVVKSLLTIALDPQVFFKKKKKKGTIFVFHRLLFKGAELVETGALVPLLEILMTNLDSSDAEAVVLSNASLELMALLCNSKQALDQARCLYCS
jgi:hypothetical protein